MSSYVRPDILASATIGLVSYDLGFSSSSAFALGTAVFCGLNRITGNERIYSRVDVCAAGLTAFTALHLGYSAIASAAWSAAAFWGPRLITYIHSSEEQTTEDLRQLIERCKHLTPSSDISTEERRFIFSEATRLKPLCERLSQLHRDHIRDIFSRMPPDPSDKYQARIELMLLKARCSNTPLDLFERKERAMEYNRLKNTCYHWGEDFKRDLDYIRTKIPSETECRRLIAEETRRRQQAWNQYNQAWNDLTRRMAQPFSGYSTRNDACSIQ